MVLELDFELRTERSLNNLVYLYISILTGGGGGGDIALEVDFELRIKHNSLSLDFEEDEVSGVLSLLALLVQKYIF